MSLNIVFHIKLMRLFRLCFDCGAFMLPLLSPIPVLSVYLSIHLFCPKIVLLPKKLDDIKHSFNIKIW